ARIPEILGFWAYNLRKLALKSSTKCNRCFHALPAYAGGKRKLNPWIFGRLAEILSPSVWLEMAFADAFVGGGSVSMFAKAQGFGELYCNDWSYRSQLILEGLIA